MNLGENNFKHLSQQFETEVLNIFKQRDFITKNTCVILKSLTNISDNILAKFSGTNLE